MSYTASLKWPWWECLYQGNWQTLWARAFSSRKHITDEGPTTRSCKGVRSVSGHHFKQRDGKGGFAEVTLCKDLRGWCRHRHEGVATGARQLCLSRKAKGEASRWIVIFGSKPGPSWGNSANGLQETVFMKMWNNWVCTVPSVQS